MGCVKIKTKHIHDVAIELAKTLQGYSEEETNEIIIIFKDMMERLP